MAGQMSHSFQRALVDWEYSLKEGLNLKELLPLLEQYYAPEKIPSKVKKLKKPELFLAYMKTRSLGLFVAFLQALDHTKGCKEHHELMMLMAPSLSNVDTTGGSADAARTIERLATAWRQLKPPTQQTASGVNTELQGISAQQTTQAVTELPESDTRSECTSVREAELTKPAVTEMDMEPETLLECTSVQEADAQSDSHVTSQSDSHDTTPPDQPRLTQLQATLASVTVTPSSSLNHSQSEQAPETTQSPSTESQQPPKGRVGCKMKKFQRAEEAIFFYDDANGISIEIPPSAVPVHIKEFCVGVYVYLAGPFRIPADKVLCTAVVWLYLHPYFTFLDDVTVKLPHAVAVAPESCDSGDAKSTTEFCLLRGPSEPCGSLYNLEEEIDAKLSNDFHVVAKVRHFCPIGGARKKTPPKGRHPIQQKLSFKHSPKSKDRGTLKQGLERMRSDSRGSSSMESSFEDQMPTPIQSGPPVPQSPSPHEGNASPHTTDPSPSESHCPDSSMQSGTSAEVFYISRLMPKDRSGLMWRVDFYVCRGHPTGRNALCSLEREDVDISTPKIIRLTGECIRFEPEDWKEGRWNVFADSPNELTREELLPFHTEDMMETEDQAQHYLRVTYRVQADPNKQEPMHLKARIEVVGEMKPNKIPYTLTNSNSTCQQSIRKNTDLTTQAYLYPENSLVLHALNNSGPASSLTLSTLEPDVQVLLADISLQYQEVESQGKPNTFGIETENTYQSLRSTAGSCPTLGSLLKVLSSVNGVKLLLPSEDQEALLHPSLSTKPVCVTSEDIYGLSDELVNIWKFVGRLMGVRDTELRRIEQNDPYNSREQSYQMLLSWQRQQGRGATYGVLFRAIQRIHEITNSHGGAHGYATKLADKLLQRQN